MIKKILIFFLIINYSLIGMKDILPLLSFHINFDFIVKEKCEQRFEIENLCMGKCQLSEAVLKQIEEETKSPEKNRTVVIKDSQFPHILNDEIEEPKDLFGEYDYYPHQINELNNFFKPQLPPPKHFA